MSKTPRTDAAWESENPEIRVYQECLKLETELATQAARIAQFLENADKTKNYSGAYYISDAAMDGLRQPLPAPPKKEQP